MWARRSLLRLQSLLQSVTCATPRRSGWIWSPAGRGRTVEVHVHPDDLGKVIGRGGRTATALRTLVAGIGGRGIRVDVVDTDQ